MTKISERMNKVLSSSKISRKGNIAEDRCSLSKGMMAIFKKNSLALVLAVLTANSNLRIFW